MMAVDEAPARTPMRRLPGATVLQIVPALVDEPAARAAVNVASALLRSGARALVAGGAGMLIGQLQALGGEWVQYASLTRNPIKLRGNARALSQLIGRERIDIVHAYSAPAAWSARIAIHNTGARLVTTYAGAPTERRKLVSLYRKALTSGHRIVAESEHAADLVIKRHKIAPERIVAIPPSIDTARFDPTAMSAERMAILRHGWGIRPGWRVILVPRRRQRICPSHRPPDRGARDRRVGAAGRPLCRYAGRLRHCRSHRGPKRRARYVQSDCGRGACHGETRHRLGGRGFAGNRSRTAARGRRRAHRLARQPVRSDRACPRARRRARPRRRDSAGHGHPRPAAGGDQVLAGPRCHSGPCGLRLSAGKRRLGPLSV